MVDTSCFKQNVIQIKLEKLCQFLWYLLIYVVLSHLWSIPPVRATPITICVVDTGYDEGHPDLPNMQDHNVTGWNAVNSDGTFPFDKWNIDGNGHGTHCAGTIGAIGNNGIGVTSVNPNPSNFKYFIGKGLSDSGSGSNANVNAAVLECVNAGAKVISMSLGGTGRSDITEQFYADQYDKDGELLTSYYTHNLTHTYTNTLFFHLKNI